MRTLVLATVAFAALITASASMAPLAASVPASAPANSDYNSDYQVLVCYATPQNLQPMSLAGIQSVLYGPGVLPSA
jgi:hypothetical protein